MSTDRLEVKPDDAGNKTLEQSAEDLKKDGVDINKDLSVNANGEGIEVREPKTEMQTSEDRPEWLPEKRKVINTIILKELRQTISTSGEIIVSHQEKMHGYGITTQGKEDTLTKT